MITSRTKKQLLVFVFITLVGVSYVGARYAQLDRLFYDSTYQVNANFKESGGIFEGAEVTYRGVGVGQVSDMRLTADGVNVVLSIEKSEDKIPADAIALVGNKSAVGEQYVELQPQTDGAPFLKDESQIASAQTRTPVSTTEILTNLDGLVTSVPQDKLQIAVTELGAAFTDTGDDLGQIIDTSNAFIQTANENFGITTSLIRNGNTVLTTQALKGSAIRSFARDLELFTGTLAANDPALRSLIRNGSATANELRTFLQANQVDLGSLINNLVTTGEVIVKKLPGIRQVLALYPYIVAGGFTVAAKNSEGVNARFGFILTQDPMICSRGYDPNERRTPLELGDKAMDPDARCTEPASKTNARGAQNAPRTSPLATYDLDTGTIAWTDQTSSTSLSTSSTPLSGEDAWTALLVQP